MKTNVTEESLATIKENVARLNTDQLLIVVDSRVWQLYSKQLEEGLSSQKDHILFKALEGESTKTIKEIENGLEYFLEKGVHRGAHLIAIGGGTTSDFGGFLAASLLRGISWSVVPTTLLSMVDASIGGKTGINSKYGKNLIGAFHMPDNVWLDISFLETLSDKEMDSGKGEIIKYAFLSNSISELLLQKKPLKEIVKACANEKQRIVEGDFKESSGRIALNLGHTFGHALEKIYDLSHGVAIFWGMALIFKVFETEELLEKLRGFEKGVDADFGAPPWLNKTFPVEKIMEFVSKDKKRRKGAQIEFVLIKNIGDCYTKLVSIEDCQSKLEGMKDELRSFNF